MRKNNNNDNKPSHKKDDADAWVDWLTNDSETVALIIIALVIISLIVNYI